MSSIPPVGPTSFSQSSDPMPLIKNSLQSLIDKHFDNPTWVSTVIAKLKSNASQLPDSEGLKDLISKIASEFESIDKDPWPPADTNVPGKIAFGKLMGTALAAQDVNNNPSLDSFSKALESLHQLNRLGSMAPIGVSPADIVNAMGDPLEQLKEALLLGQIPSGQMQAVQDAIKAWEGHINDPNGDRSAMLDHIRHVGANIVGGAFNQ